MTSSSSLHNSFALIEKNNKIVLYEGSCLRLNDLAELSELKKKSKKHIVFMVPFSMAREKGCEVKGNEKILALIAEKVRPISRAEINTLVGDITITLEKNLEPDISDEVFANKVKEIQEQEIEEGKACQVVFSRKFKGVIKDMAPEIPLVLFRRLLNQRGQYLTFLFSDGKESYFVGATPERQLEIAPNTVIKSPLAGTMPKKKGDFKKRMELFLKDRKEINELAQILDEELKMMARICPQGGKIKGPFLRESGAVIHTEYQLIGRGSTEAIVGLKECMHAPTLVGSPLKSAFRIIARHEKESRGYYGGEIGLLNPEGTMDSAILIRTAKIDLKGGICVQAGAGIVRDSVPEKEVKETIAKAQGLMRALLEEGAFTEQFLGKNKPSEFKKSLEERNQHLSRFHYQDQFATKKEKSLQGLRVSIIHNEDDFADMMGHIVRHLGCVAEIIDTFNFNIAKDGSDLVILGPGPGNINDKKDQRMKKLLTITRKLIENKKPILGICLGHQALAKTLGMRIEKQPVATQGLQLKINLFGQEERVGFYNSFSPVAKKITENIRVSIDKKGRIMALKKEGMIGYQFHPESVLSQNGYMIIKKALLELSKKRNKGPKLNQIESFIEGSIKGTISIVGQKKFLTELNQKGYDGETLAHFVKTLQKQIVYRPELPKAIDLCGTGGSGLPRINTSTLSAFIVAACGVPVAKHGNKAASGRFGSFDLLEKMDIAIDLKKERLEGLFKRTKLVFMFARSFHPAMKCFAEARKEVGTKTIFNLLGPLLNPADAKKQIIGVSCREDMKIMIEACKMLGKKHILVVSGSDGLDEVTLTGPTEIRELFKGKIKSYRLQPEDFGFKKAPFSSIAGGSEIKNMKKTNEILENRCKTDHLKLVLMNAGLALKFTGKVKKYKEGVKIAARAIRKGNVLTLLETYRRESHLSGLLAEIRKNKEKEVYHSKKKLPFSVLKKSIKHSTRDFAGAFKNKDQINLIAEIKRSSPCDKNVYHGKKSVRELASLYEASGVSAISVLTDQKYFQGSLNDLRAVKAATSRIPVLRKDFIIDEYQIYEARHYGADAILLIVALLDRKKIEMFIQIAQSLKMDVILEIHSPYELEIALKTKAKIIGINNRDLNTFTVDPLTTLRLAPKVPKDHLIIAESGYNEKNIRLSKGIANGFLVGTSILKKENIGKAIQELKQSQKWIKACGIRTVDMAKKCEKAGVQMVGLNFAQNSKRKIGIEKAKKIRPELKSSLAVGVFQNQPIKTVEKIADELKLDIVQLSGNETPEYCRQIKHLILKTIPIDSLGNADLEHYPENVIAYIIDSPKPGSGQVYDYSKIKGISLKKPFLVAGGIDSKNALGVLKMAPECLGIDVASGIETKGKVDPKKISALLRIIRNS